MSTKRPAWAQRLWFWATDGQFRGRDRTPAEKGRLGRALDRVDPDWDRQDSLLGKPLVWMLCAAYGHKCVNDQCGMPGHRFCVYCSTSMPNSPVDVDTMTSRKDR